MRGVGVRYLSACWSTLGGAHSALGECSQAHVRNTHTQSVEDTSSSTTTAHIHMY